jgi:hypothetical protein
MDISIPEDEQMDCDRVEKRLRRFLRPLRSGKEAMANAQARPAPPPEVRFHGLIKSVTDSLSDCLSIVFPQVFLLHYTYRKAPLGQSFSFFGRFGPLSSLSISYA